MYNFLVTANKTAWDAQSFEIDRSRFLEYTNDETSEIFKTLNQSNIQTLKTLPCLFAYEGFDEDVRIGHIKSIQEKGRYLVIEYEFYEGIGVIPFSDIEPIAKELDIRKWEMHRTHWAIKDVNLIEQLQNASLIDLNLSIPTLRSPVNKRQDDKSWPKVTTVKGFVDKVLSEVTEKNMEVFYRGHSNRKKYKLEPSLFRKDDKGNYIYLHNEDILYKELIVSNAIDFESDEYTLDRLVRMQHYSLPTRLLDITSNPLIALYFACKSNFGKKVSGKIVDEEEGEVIVLSLRRDQLKYYDSDTASCLAGLARLPKSDKDDIDFTHTEIKNFNDQQPIKRLTHFIRGEKPFFESKIVPDDLRKIICVKSKKSNDRINFQSGAFLLFGLDAVLDEKGNPEIEVKRITVSNKLSILKELDLLNINESTVFPYIENSAKYVAQKYAFKPEDI